MSYCWYNCCVSDNKWKSLSPDAPIIIWVLCPAGTKRDCVPIPIFCKKLDGKKSLSCKLSLLFPILFSILVSFFCVPSMRETTDFPWIPETFFSLNMLFDKYWFPFARSIRLSLPSATLCVCIPLWICWIGRIRFFGFLFGASLFKPSAVGNSRFTLILSTKNPSAYIISSGAPGIAFTWI